MVGAQSSSDAASRHGDPTQYHSLGHLHRARRAVAGGRRVGVGIESHVCGRAPSAAAVSDSWAVRADPGFARQRSRSTRQRPSLVTPRRSSHGLSGVARRFQTIEAALSATDNSVSAWAEARRAGNRRRALCLFVVAYLSCIVVVTPLFVVPYLSNQLRTYSCVRRKFDGVLLVPWYSLFMRIIAVGTPAILSAR